MLAGHDGARRVATGLGRARSRLGPLASPGDGVHLAALCLPVLIVDVLLDLSQAMSQYAPAARWLGLTAIPADLLIHLGLVGLWLVSSLPPRPVGGAGCVWLLSTASSLPI